MGSITSHPPPDKNSLFSGKTERAEEIEPTLHSNVKRNKSLNNMDKGLKNPTGSGQTRWLFKSMAEESN